MANRWGIPAPLEQKIRRRDKRCVYCGAFFRADSRRKVSWEHIDNDENHICEENVVLCCKSCNSSKGAKTLSEWLDSPFCEKNKITPSTMSEIIRRYLRRFPARKC